MGRNLAPKAIMIVVLVVVAFLTLYPPSKTLTPGIDLAGGTSLIWEIDTEGLDAEKKKELSTRMINVLRRRIDPANIQNLVWRPQGNTRFEIQMPLASAEALEKRRKYEKAKRELLAENVNLAVIMRSVQKSPEARAEDFENLAHGTASRLVILNDFATAYDEREELRKKRDGLVDELKSSEEELSAAGFDLDGIKANRTAWMNLGEEKLAEELKDFLGSEERVDLLAGYVKTFGEWAQVEDELTEPESGKIAKYEVAKREVDKLNLTEEQIEFILEKPVKSRERKADIQKLRTDFADRADKIDRVIEAFDEYRPFRGRLDDPEDLRRMLKGAGILEYRILPTADRTELTAEEVEAYVESLIEKGPKYASDNKYVWCEIEGAREDWGVPNSIVGPFGDKWYVLASNRRNETLLHSPESEKAWKLEKARPTQDRMGRRAVGFKLNERGGKLFSNVTGANIGRPLCILLDEIAISAPNIQDRIRTEGIITGNFSQTEVTDMVNKLNAGSLPARLIEQPILIKTIGPSIGADNRDQGIKAGLIGLATVVLCMAVYYTLAGSIADLALLMNLLFVLATMALIRATFTLPGIAGIILTIGMSVDANVLIFERIREEQQKGSSLRIAIRNGYQRAFRTIFDANLTTFITAAILYWRASEEVKGFAIVLMLGIMSSMFTALFVTRVVFDILLGRRIIKDHLLMLRIIRQPKVDWMRLRPVLFGISALLIAGGLLVFFTRSDKYDIEFTGGTSAQLNLKEALERQEVQDRIREVGKEMSPALGAAKVYSIGESGKQYEINTTETNKTTSTVVFDEAGERTPENLVSAMRKAHVFDEAGERTPENLVSAIEKAQAGFEGRLSNLAVTAAGNPGEFVVTTSQVNKSLVRNVLKAAFPDANVSAPQVDEVVNETIAKAFKGLLEIQENLEPAIASEEKITEEVVDSQPELAHFLGGIKFSCEIRRAVTAEELRSRLTDLQFKPDMRDLTRYPYHKVLDTELNEPDPNAAMASFVYVNVEPEAGFRELSEEEWRQFVENERAKVLAAMRLETSLPRVTQIDPSVGAEAKTRALIAIILSLSAIVGYIWLRFGNVRYGIAAITALVHDVCITLGAVTACAYIAGTGIGERLLIGDFKIDLAIIAAFLTLIGYSLNDTIVVFDRIRENRKKLRVNRQIVTDSINQTISRTLLTSLTTFIVVLIMYIFGGPGLRGFTFAIGLGVIVGTYSSIAIASPVLLLGAKAVEEKGRK